MDKEDVKENIQKTETWMRLFPMIVLGIAFKVTEIILLATVIIQFFAVLISNNKLQTLHSLSESLGKYMQSLVVFLTYASDEKPFPFREWDS